MPVTVIVILFTILISSRVLSYLILSFSTSYLENFFLRQKIFIQRNKSTKK